MSRAETRQSNRAQHAGHFIHERVHAEISLRQSNQMDQIPPGLFTFAQQRRTSGATHGGVRTPQQAIDNAALLFGHTQRSACVSISTSLAYNQGLFFLMRL